MKKALLALTFISVALFAQASNGKVKKGFPSKTVTTSKKSEKAKTVKVAQWMSSFTCNGKKYTVCCFDTQAESHAQGVYLASIVCD
jgi:hypothetical protein